jgi:transglutaminase-like putative cysteine protease
MSFEVTATTPMVFMLRPRSIPGQWVAGESYRLSPSIEVVEYTDLFGNLCQRLVAPIGHFEIQTSVDVVLKNPDGVFAGPRAFVEIPDLPDSVLAYLLPSRYCESDRFGDMAIEIVGDNVPGYDQVVAIANWVRNNISNVPLSSTYPVSAVEINQRRQGVCRDLAQLSIALCRALCIPARLVVGYLHGLAPMDIHAWFEAYVGNQWCTFDPSVAAGSTSARISIAQGRDAADVAIYNQFGPLLLPLDMRVWVEKDIP